jgi:hypothetical protein
LTDLSLASPAPRSAFGSRCEGLVRLALLGCFLVSSPALAQDESASDKANARTLATEGIDLYTEGRYAEALDRLQRAQALFDAPIHLLYIARAQARLGKLIEATETYRRLIRVELRADTPAAVREAVEAADAELDGVDARLAALRIEVVPQGEPGLVLVIDGVQVSAAVVGVDRPLNPGHHRIQASVPDGRRAETSIDLGDGARASVRLELGPANAPSGRPSRPRQPEVSRVPQFAWILGGDLGVSLPVGNVSRGVPMSDYLKSGVALGVHGGIRFAGFLGAKLFLDFGGYVVSEAPSVDFGSLSSDAGPDAVAKVDTTVTSQSLGFSLLAGSAPGRLGGYGELGLVIGQRLHISRDIKLDGGECGDEVEQSLSLTGGALRAGGGAFIPVSPFFQLTPFVHGSFGRFTNAELDPGCEVLRGPSNLSGEIEGERRATHGLIVLGIGGEFVLGAR